MKPTMSGPQVDTASHMESLCRERLRALVRGEFSEDEFISEFATVPENLPEAQWNLAEWISRQHNSGQVPDALFHSLESKIARLDGGDADDGQTAELYPLGRRRRSRPPQFIEGPGALARRAIEPGVVLRDRYLIETRLGTGGMGTVYKALDRFRGDLEETNRHVAIKILNDDITNRPEVFAKLRREFYCAQSLAHRNIVRVYELDRDGDLSFFTMEFLEGELLSRIIERFAPGTVTRSYAWRVVREVGAALAHAHARDVVHADLKPQNVLITHSGDVRLLDFGTSSASVGANSGQGATTAASRLRPTALTPAYASCELLEGRRPDPRDDLFAFACLTYEILTGEHPFGQRRSTDARAQGIKPVRPANLGEQQWKTLSLGLAFNRADRSMSVRDWVLAINQPDEVPALLETQPVLTRAASVDTRPVFTRPTPAEPSDSGRAEASNSESAAAESVGRAAIPADSAPGTALPVPVPAMTGDVIVVAPAPRGLPTSPARWLVGRVMLLAFLVMWAAAHRPGARVAGPLATPAPVTVTAPVATAPVAATATSTPTSTSTGTVTSTAATPLTGPVIAASAAPPAARVPAASVVAPHPAAPTLAPVAKSAALAARAAKAAASSRRAGMPVAAPAAIPAIGIERAKYWVRPGRHFLEVHVTRSAGTRGDANFVWWTEPGTARPDEDFFMQTKTTQTFSAGVKTATLFVRIMPNPARRAPRTFYVRIGSPSAGHVLGGVTKAPVLVLPGR